MNKKQALTHLLGESVLFTDELKEKIMSKLDTLSEEDINNLGKFLAQERLKRAQNSDEIVNQLNSMEDYFEAMEKKTS
jgi:hypothetical protein